MVIEYERDLDEEDQLYVFESAEDDIDVLPMTTEIPTFDPTLVIVQAPTYETRFQNFLVQKTLYINRESHAQLQSTSFYHVKCLPSLLVYIHPLLCSR